MNYFRLLVSEGRKCLDENLSSHAESLDRAITKYQMAKSQGKRSELMKEIESEALSIRLWRSSTAGPIPQAILEAQSNRERNGRGGT